MYEAHFGLSDQPFGLTPNTQYFLNAQGHREALNLLQVALGNGEGFIKVVGEVGTGKTMLCRKLLNTLTEEYCTAYIPNPMLNPAGLYRALATELGIHCKSRDGINEYQQSINAKLIELASVGKKVVLVIDEAQSMPPKTLEALRLISNLETETTKLVHIVLFGQPELDRMLNHDSLRQLRQRITFSYALPPMTNEGSKQYILHRLSTAGYNGNQLFSDKALDLIYQVSEGVPRVVNILCHKAMMSAYGKGAKVIDRVHVRAAVQDTDGLKAPAWFSFWPFKASVAAVSVGALSLLSVSTLLVSGGVG